jgi:beta-lactamase class D
MKAILALLAVLLAHGAWAKGNCFIAQENNQIIVQEGDCHTRHTPCSTFKVALSLMGYNEGILVDETNPEWQFQKGHVDHIENWKQAHNPKLWMKNSCVWYSQEKTKKLGEKKFRQYLQKFNYGNQDGSGDKGMNNGLTNSWLGSSLEISPEEQVEFLNKLLHNSLPVSDIAHEMTKNIIYVEELNDDWQLYGKTGACTPAAFKGMKGKQIGWFIGWLSKGERTIIFANYMEPKNQHDIISGPRAREIAKEKLLEIIAQYPQ